MIVRDPVDDEPAHALLVGRKGKPEKRCLLEATLLLVAPTG
jgi:hypothetical protein